MRIDLHTYTTIVLLTSVIPAAVDALRARCIRQSSLLSRHPFHLLNFVREHRMRELEDNVEHLWGQVEALDLKTGIEPAWRRVQGHGRVKKDEDFGALLRELHEVGTELRLINEIARLVGGLGGQFRKLIEKTERLRAKAGLASISNAVRAEWEDQVAFDEDRVTMTAKKFEASIERVQAQINVTYSLIAQNSSEQNIQIARLTAKDSQTMKTITVLTLTFLPSTMLAVRFPVSLNLFLN
ncbi:hypothetical protein N0V90_001951 [Kalmusia sp. IMI 367209]|nr:hypothetical protein N0V90_001951 [Kalmusia sp. IMI 367209]